ncbi:14241_t:CDS:1, partial [Entrophospora sp. SA101]
MSRIYQEIKFVKSIGIGKTSVMYKGLYDNDRVLQYAHSLNVCNKEMEIMEKLDLACFLKIPDLNLADY